MSFDFNPSDDEGEDQELLEELWKNAAKESIQENSDDEDDDNIFEGFSLISPTPTYASAAKLPTGFGLDDDNGEESEGEDSVNWEDGAAGAAVDDENNIDDGDQKLPADTTTRPLQAVTIDLGKKPPANKKDEDETKRKRKKIKRRRSYRLSSLPRHTQSLLMNLHMAHWLALTSHVAFMSSQCSTELILSLAYSLLPVGWTESCLRPMKEAGGYNVPSLQELKSFCYWYFDLVHNAEERLRTTQQANMAAGAPRQARGRRRGGSQSKRKRGSGSMDLNNSSLRSNQVSSPYRLVKYCSYLSASMSDDPQLFQQSERTESWSDSDRVNLFIAMTRSMGWRARYLGAIDPIKTDLDPDHPMLLGAMSSVFKAVSSWSQAHPKLKRGGEKIKSRKRPRQSTKADGLTKADESPVNGMAAEMGAGRVLLGWVEVLCQVDNGGAKSTRQAKKQQTKTQLKWVSVDPSIQAIDQPHRVECLLYEQLQQLQQCDGNDDSSRMKRKSSRGMSKKGRPVAYVIAAEHSGESESQRLRVTDVSPRYAASMVETLKLRGVPAKNQAKVLSSLKSCWWSKAITNLNAASKPTKKAAGKSTPHGKKPPTPPSLGKSSDEAIDIESEDEDIKDDQDDDEEDGAENFEKEELAKSASNETIPTAKEKFKTHPLYVIQSVLKKAEVLAPDAKKRVCGFFKGEMVYKRSDVSEALTEKKWLYQGRKVKRGELGNPIKRIKARAKSSKGGGSFKALVSYGVGKENDGSEEHKTKQLELAEKPLDDGMQDLYAIWQTRPWSPPYVGPNDKIPVNEYKNIEKALINPGLAHIDVPKIAPVAKQLGIPYAPCLLGFEGHRGNRTPTIRGIVVHQHNAQLLREASVEVVSKSIEDENENRRRTIYARWKQLLVGVLTKDRLDREYG